MRRAPPVWRCGYTLIEVLVAILLLALFSPIIADLCRTNGLSISDVNNRSAIVRETGFITSMLASDFGRATSLSVPGDGSLHLQIYSSPFSTSEEEIVYSCDNNFCLWRSDVGSGQTNMVATGVQSFGVMLADANTVRLDVLMGRGTNQRRLIFMGGVP